MPPKKLCSKIILIFFTRTIIFLIILACNPLASTDDEFIISEATAPSEAFTNPNTYYISNQGDNDADGRTREAAFQTISQALEIVQPGDTILILPGTYNETLVLEGAGNSHAPITVRSDGGLAVLDGQGSMTIGFWCDNCANFVFENLEIRNYTDIGIGVHLSSNIIIRNLVVHNNGFEAQLVDWEIEGYGIHVDESQGITIDNNEVYQNGPQPQVSGRLMGTGINTYMCTNCIIRNNRSYDNVGGGILVEDSSNVLVEGNEIYANDLDATLEEWWDGGIWLDGGRNVVVRDNVFRDNLGPGIQISDEDHQQPYGYVVENNVSTGNYYGVYIWNFGTANFPPENILRMSNNQISGNTRQNIWIVPWN